ncbi:MAG: Phosphoribosylglycinamide formyltransferase [Alphaproteobacteria bacterium MarineAlpha2_Bin1]|nr:MAG: Phosphoribosylglycinamide formyltransferase [Alphaproteobacteria bacterium MarineAlpha2_Bin1]
MFNLGILISGRGTNLENIFNFTKKFPTKIKISSVISNNPNALGIEIAKQNSLPLEVINHRKFIDRESFEREIDLIFKEKKVDLICNAGFMRILTSWFVNRWFNKQINIHPSLLPSYTGLDTHQRAINDGVKFTGCTVHYVRSELDSGPIINQAVVPISPNDTEKTLSERVLKAEHIIYPQAINLIVDKKLEVIDNNIIYKEHFLPKTILINPIENN